MTDFGETEAICTEVRDDPARSEGVLLKVMARPLNQSIRIKMSGKLKAIGLARMLKIPKRTQAAKNFLLPDCRKFKYWSIAAK